MCAVFPETAGLHMSYTPGGLLYKPVGSQLQSTAAMSFLILTYADYLSKSSQQLSCGNLKFQPDSLRRIVKRQVLKHHLLLCIYALDRPIKGICIFFFAVHRWTTFWEIIQCTCHTWLGTAISTRDRSTTVARLYRLLRFKALRSGAHKDGIFSIQTIQTQTY